MIKQKDWVLNGNDSSQLVKKPSPPKLTYLVTNPGNEIEVS